jgi:thiamine kinase-like enzyme
LDKINSPFFYIPCDTYFDQNIVDNFIEDTYFVKQVEQPSNYHYTTFKLDNDRIIDYKFKEDTDSEWYAFTGVMFIKEYDSFKDRLSKLDSSEIIYTIQKHSKTKILASWLDFGNLDIYVNSLKQTQKFDFAKTDEVTYITNNKVIKYWKDDTIASKKYRKCQSNIDVYPQNTIHKGNFLAYDYFQGKTMYENTDLTSFTMMLDWLDKSVWKKQFFEARPDALTFYKMKTLKRVDMFLQKYPDLSLVTHVDNVPVKDYRFYLGNMEWDLLYSDVIASYIHGDLQFDNIIVSDDNKFKIIDWRHEFGNLVEIGDLYYDLAKLYGGLILDYSKIKNNQFGFSQVGDKVELSIPNVENFDFYSSQLLYYIKYKNYNLYKVKMLIPVIFWNMAPLHHAPFDKFLWYLGIKLFEELRQ